MVSDLCLSINRRICGIVRFVLQDTRKFKNPNKLQVVGIFSGIEEQRFIDACAAQPDLIDIDGNPVHKGFKCLHPETVMGVS